MQAVGTVIFLCQEITEGKGVTSMVYINALRQVGTTAVNMAGTKSSAERQSLANSHLLKRSDGSLRGITLEIVELRRG